jgi:Amt family ammonium transporter
VWPLHGLCGALGGIAAGVLGLEELGGLGKVAFMPQLLGTALAITIALTGGFVVYAVLKKFVGLRLDPEQEFTGADLTLHKVSASPENESGW